jgi:winged helix DNA-binding protein
VNADAIRRRRAASQLLHAPRRRAPHELVRHLLGVQAQVASQAALGLRARSGGLTTDLVREARERERSIVRTWAMRGTIYLLAAEDHGLLVPLVTEPREANAFRRLRQEGVPAEEAERAIGLVEGMLETHGALTRPEIADRLRRRRIRTEGQAIAHLVWLAAARGATCFGPDRGGEETYVLVRDWLGEPEPMEREPALAELAIRYLRSHAPAGPQDLASWAGLRLADAKRAWGHVADRLREVPTPAGPAWALGGRQVEVRRLPARLLPAFDEFLLGWKDRDAVVAAPHRSRVNRGGGWLHPVAIADGRVIATWRIARSGTTARLDLEPFVRLTPSVVRELRREAKEVGAFLGVPITFD